MDDLISRQVALETIRTMQTYKLFAGDDMILIDKAQVQTELMMLPSVQPETNCSEIPNNSDTISRQAAIEAVVGCTNCGTEDVLRAYVTKHSLENGWTGGIVDALDAIEQLPSAQPEHCGDAVSRNAIIQKLNQMDRYVSAELRLCDTDKKFPQNEVFIVDDVYEEIVEQLPSVQPERPTGEWIQKPRYEDDEYPDVQPNLKCPFCGYEIGWCDMGNYCARCGADLEGGEAE